MKYISLILALSFCLNAQAEVNFINTVLKNNRNEYLEERERFKQINIHTKSSPLKELKETSKKDIKFWNKIDTVSSKLINNFGTELSFNKITGMANGIINVRNQVRVGVKQAIKETFGGYAEYQRRKQVEEIANSTFQNRQKVANLLIRNDNQKRSFFSFNFNQGSYSYRLIKNINRNHTIKGIRKVILRITFLVLFFMMVLKILVALKHGTSISETFTRPFINLFLYIIAIACGSKFFSVNIQLMTMLSSAFNQILSKFQVQEQLSLTETWTDFAAHNGYFPTLILSIFDMLSQVFISFFYIAVIAYIVFGMIFYPFWIVFSVFKPSQLVLLESYISWIKANLIIVFSPILIIIFRIISLELSNDYIFMSILAKTLSFYSTPLLCFFIFFKTKPIINFEYEKIDYSSQFQEEIKDLLKK